MQYANDSIDDGSSTDDDADVLSADCDAYLSPQPMG